MINNTPTGSKFQEPRHNYCAVDVPAAFALGSSGGFVYSVTLFSTVKSRLNLLALLPLLIFFGATFALFQYHVRDLVVEDYRQHLAGVLDTEVRLIENWLQERRRGINTMAIALEGHTGSNADIRKRLKSFLPFQNEFYAAGFADPEGKVLLRTDYRGRNTIADRPFFQKAASGSGVISQAYREPTTGIPTLACASPVYRSDGRLAGVLFGLINLAELDSLVQQATPASLGDTYLTDLTGTFLTAPDLTSVFITAGGDRYDPVLRTNIASRLFAAAVSYERLEHTYRDYAGRSVYGTYRWLRDGNWLLIGETPADRIYARYSGFTTLLMFMLGIALVLVVSVVLSLSKTIAVPLRALEREMQQVKEEGSSDLRPDWRVFKRAPVEIRSLAYSFHTMEEQLSDNLKALQETTITDHLTRLYNRRHLFEEGYRYVHMIRRTRIPLACLILDIDHFKEVNDTHGHAVGDQVLREVSREMRSNIRETDFPARYGGEEFVILAYRADRQQALQLAERLRESIAAQVHRTEAGSLQITVSIGCSLLHESRQADRSRQNVKAVLDRLIRIADDALYEAKAAGRNRVAFGGMVDGEL